MGRRKQLVTVVIPCYNEVTSIAELVHAFLGKSLAARYFAFDVLVIDNASKDGTAEAARAAGARVLYEPRQGKGNAMRTGFANLDPDARFVVMLDGDATYHPEEVLRMLEPLHHNFCDAVVGSRLGGKIHGDAMTYLNRGGNWGFTHLTRFIYRVNITDVFSGYFAWKREVIVRLAPQLHAQGFAIEMEMVTKMARMGYELCSVPISYHNRAGESSLRPFRDGFRILGMFLKNLSWTQQQPRTAEEELVEEAA